MCVFDLPYFIPPCPPRSKTDRAQPNIVQVVEMREDPEVMIVMRYFPSGSIAQAQIYDKSKLVTAFGQLLDCLAFLQSRNVTHRDIKPDNVLVELRPHFKVVLSDFGMSKTVTETTWLQTFCGTLKYMAPEVFPFSKAQYGPPADVWSLGVMALGWLHGIPEPAPRPEPAPGAQQSVSPRQWQHWAQTWVDTLVAHLHEQEDGVDIELLQGMLATNQTKRRTAHDCLTLGLENGLFTRRAVDKLVACATAGESEADVGSTGGDDPEAPATPWAGAKGDDDPDATIVLRSGSPAEPAAACGPAHGSKEEPPGIFVRSRAPSLTSSSIPGVAAGGGSR